MRIGIFGDSSRPVASELPDLVHPDLESHQPAEVNRLGPLVDPHGDQFKAEIIPAQHRPAFPAPAFESDFRQPAMFRLLGEVDARAPAAAVIAGDAEIIPTMPQRFRDRLRRVVRPAHTFTVRPLICSLNVPYTMTGSVSV